MAQQLVADVRLGRVQRPRVVADVLRAVEHSESEPGQEISGGEEAGHGTESEACAV